MQRGVLCCNGVCCVALWCAVLQRGVLCCNVVCCVALWYAVLQRGVLCCNGVCWFALWRAVLQLGVLCCSVLPAVNRARLGSAALGGSGTVGFRVSSSGCRAWVGVGRLRLNRARKACPNGLLLLGPQHVGDGRADRKAVDWRRAQCAVNSLQPDASTWRVDHSQRPLSQRPLSKWPGRAPAAHGAEHKAMHRQDGMRMQAVLPRYGPSRCRSGWSIPRPPRRSVAERARCSR